MYQLTMVIDGTTTTTPYPKPLVEVMGYAHLTWHNLRNSGLTLLAVVDDAAQYTYLVWRKGTKSQPAQLPAGYYMVDGKRYVVNAPTTGNWAGYSFLATGSDYNSRKTLAGRGPKGWTGRTTDHGRAVWSAIALDPMAAMAAYGHGTGKCGRCNRKLEDPTSIALGIGPVCINALGW